MRAAPQLCNSLLVHDWDMEGNGLATPQDTSYTGQPLRDCVAAFLANRFKVVSLCQGLPEIEILARDCTRWYLDQTGGQDSGLNIDDALTALMTTGMVDAQGVPHTILGHSGIDWTNQTAVMQALTNYFSLDLGVDSSALEGIVGDSNGWIVTGVDAKLDSYDHSVGSFDYGPAGFLADCYKINLNGRLGQDDFAIGLETWGTVGIVEYQSWCNMIGEAWVIDLQPNPPPAPIPPTPELCCLASRGIEVFRRAIDLAKAGDNRIVPALDWLEQYLQVPAATQLTGYQI
jgi:hypothetical protein